MAINYTQRFTEIGKLIKRSDAVLSTITGLDANRDEIEDAYEANDQTHVIEGIASEFNSVKQGLVAFRRRLGTWAELSLLDRNDVLEQLALTTASLPDVLRELIRDMVEKGQTVNRSTVTLGAVQRDLTDHGAGVPLAGLVFTTKVLDGYSSPGVGFPAHRLYDGLDSELAVPTETQYLTCVADSQADGRPVGEEEFDWFGKIADQPFGFETEASGQGPSVRTLNAETILQNRYFEDFTSNAPDSWTIVDGTAGEHIFQTTASERVFRGSSALEFRGNGVQESIEIKQAIDLNQIQPRRRYCLAFPYMVDLAASAGDLTVRFESTGYSPVASEQVVVESQNLESTWQTRRFFINMPEILPADLALVIRWNGTPRANHGPGSSSSSSGTEDKGEISLFIGWVAFGPVPYHGGNGAVVVAGRTRFVRGDRLYWSVENNEGVFQRFARRQFGVQFPSSGSPTIADAWAT